MSDEQTSERAQFTRMADGRVEDWIIIGRSTIWYGSSSTPDCIKIAMRYSFSVSPAGAGCFRSRSSAPFVTSSCRWCRMS